MRMLTPDLIYLGAVLAMVAVAVVNITFAIGVFADSSRIGRTRIVPGPMWAFATLVGGVLVATAYWFIHHSTHSDRD